MILLSRLLAWLTTFLLGAQYEQNRQARLARKEMERQAEIDVKPVTPDNAFGGLRNFGRSKGIDGGDATAVSSAARRCD